MGLMGLSIFADAAPNYKYMFMIRMGTSTSHHLKIHIIKNTMMKQSRGFNDDLQPDQKKATNISTMDPIIGTSP